MDFLKCAGIINNEYYYSNGSGLVFPERTDPTLKNITTDPSIDFIFDRGCVYDGYEFTYILGASNKDPNTTISYRVSTLENQNNTISVDQDNQLAFSHAPDLSQPVIFIAKNSGDNSEWCALYNSNDTNAVYTVWEDCKQTKNPEIITTTLNITDLNNWVADAKSNIIYHLTNTNLSLYNASTSMNTPSKTFGLDNDILLTQNHPWRFTVANNSDSFEFAVTDGIRVQTVLISDGVNATVNLINNTGVRSDSSFVFSKEQPNTLQSIDGNGRTQLVAISQDSATQTNGILPADPSVSPPINSGQSPVLSTGQIVGIAVGSGVFLLLLLLAMYIIFIRPRGRKKRGFSIAASSTAPIIPPGSSTNQYGASSAGLEEIHLLQEGDPDFTEYSRIFNNSCDIRTDEIGEEISEGIFLRKCEYISKRKIPAVIHYFTSARKEQFDHSLMVLKKLNGPSDRVLQHYKAFKLVTLSPNHQIEYILITSGYESKNNLHILYAREGDLHDYINLSDNVFKVWVVYSILTAIQALHDKNFTHNHLSLASFYAETSAPSMDWTLGDFYYAQVNNPEAKASDILRVGHMIYDIVFEQIPQAQQSDYANIQLDTTKIEGPYREHFSFLLEHTFYPDSSQQLDADQLLEYWKRHFKF